MFGRLELSGYPAWLMWLLAHIYFLINFRNRLAVMIDWALVVLDLQPRRANHPQGPFVGSFHSHAAPRTPLASP
jgi:hypothetical protein